MADLCPRIRQDLELLSQDDSRSDLGWTIFDPVANRFFRFGQHEIEIIRVMFGRTPRQVSKALAREASLKVTEQEVSDLVDFLRANALVQNDKMQTAIRLSKDKTRRGLLALLFLRLPLVNPDRFMHFTLPWVKPLASPTAFKLYGLMLVCGMYLTVQQWDAFTATFIDLVSLKGLIGYVCALFIVKIFHELGHGYTAKAKGCHVPIMGVTFIVGWPVLYTDTTDAWRLTSRRDRIHIDVAGVSVEMVVASVALLVWNLFPSGFWGGVAFLLATSTWLMSLLVNLNPLMRFDGYYLLSDYWQEENLEQRSFNLCRWYLRDRLLGLKVEPPEAFQLRLVLYALAVWIYRLFLFLGISLMVYNLLFKAAGLLMMSACISHFILRPVLMECHYLMKHRALFNWNRRALLTCLFVISLLSVLFIPFSTTIKAPTALKIEHAVIYSPSEGFIEKVNAREGQTLKQGHLIARIDEPHLAHQIELAAFRLRELEFSLEASNFDENQRHQYQRLKNELKTQQDRYEKLLEQQQNHTLLAPRSGIVTNLNPDITDGSWLPKNTKLLTIIASEATQEAYAYVNSKDRGRLQVGASGHVYFNDMAPISVTIEEIEPFTITHLEDKLLAHIHNGAIDVTLNGEHYTPVQSWYRVRITLAEPVKARFRLKGTSHFDAHPRSVMQRVWLLVQGIVIRESGF